MKASIFMLAACFLLACETAETTNPDAPVNDAASSESSKEERNKKTLSDLYDALGRLDTARAAELMADDIVDYGDGSMEPARGSAQAMAAMGQWMRSVENFNVDGVKMLAEGDQVWAFGTFSMKFKDDVMGLPTKGKSVKMDDVDMITFNEEGKITSHRSVQSPHTFFGELGIAPPKQQ